MNKNQLITVFSRVLIRPSVQTQLNIVSQRFAEEALGPLLGNGTSVNAAGITSILSTSPQTILAPIGYTINNLVPFDNPVFVVLHTPLQIRELIDSNPERLLSLLWD